MIPDIFKDKALQNEFNEQGFVKVKLLSAEDIEKLTALFYQFHSNLRDNAFGASSFHHNRAEKFKIRDTLYPIFLPYFNQLFKDYTYFGSSYLYKTKGRNSDLAPHQDWTIVDEKKYVAINIWTPLIDTNEQNGTLFVLPGSQAQKHFTLRAPTIPFHFQNKMKKVLKDSIPTNASAGEAVILNQSLIHYSTPNIANDIRIAITSGIKTKDAPMLFHYKNERNKIERYTMPEDFLLDFENFETDIYKRPVNGVFEGMVEEEKMFRKLLNKLLN
ncbi:MAG: phytanoyl-CoA dioxygenase family protein [Chitinophagales bacterium]